MVIDEESDDLESYDSNPALFSDDEDPKNLGNKNSFTRI
jgi:hypothetical protein